jgi:integrase
VKHHAALDFSRVPELRARSGVSAKALELTILTAVRTAECIGSNWDEIDLRQGAWNIDRVRVKTDRDYRVPLSDRAVEIVKSLDRDNPLLFPSPSKPHQPVSNAAMSKLLKDLGYKSSVATVHGFRSTFCDWAAEKSDYATKSANRLLATELATRLNALIDVAICSRRERA